MLYGQHSLISELLPDINLGSNPYLNLLQFRIRETIQESRNRDSSTLFRWINSVCGSVTSRSIVIILEDWPEVSENCSIIEDTLLGLRDKIPSLTVYFCGNEASHGYPMNTDVLFPRLWGAGITVENSFGFDETVSIHSTPLTAHLSLSNIFTTFRPGRILPSVNDLFHYHFVFFCTL